jgi:hypothetical protein
MITLRPVQSDDDVEAWLPEARRRLPLPLP